MREVEVALPAMAQRLQEGDLPVDSCITKPPWPADFSQ